MTPRAPALQCSPRWQLQPWGRSRRTPARAARRPRPAGPARPPCASCPAGSGGSPPGSSSPPSGGRPGQQPPRSSPGTKPGAKGSLGQVRGDRTAWGPWRGRRGTAKTACSCRSGEASVERAEQEEPVQAGGGNRCGRIFHVR